MNTRFPSVRRGLLAVSLGVLALSGVATGAPLPGDDFEADDGNLAVGGAATTDWNAASPGVFNDLPTNADNTLTNGAQEDNPVADWGLAIVNNTNAKADLLRAYTKLAMPYFRLGIVRNQAANGTVAYHVEFNQSTAKHANGMPVRTVGDALIVYDFQGGDLTATLTRHRWVTAGDCAGNATQPCWDEETTLNPAQAVGANNTVGVLDTVANPDQTLAAKTFDELAINLQSAFDIPANRCLSFGQVSIRSREGGSFGSALQDLMGPMPISVGNCDVAIEKDVVTVDGSDALNPSSVPFDATLAYRVRVFLGQGSSPVAASQLTVTDTTVSDDSLNAAPLVPVRYLGVISGDDGDDILERYERWVYALDHYGRRVTQTATTCDDVVNSATVAVTGGDTSPGNNLATRTTPVTCVPDVAIRKSAPSSVGYGDTITYTVDVANVGDPVAIPRADIDVTDPAVTDAALEFASVVTGDEDAYLEVGEVWRYALAGGGAVTRPANTCSPIDNTAVVATLTGETNTTDNTSTVTTTVTCVPDIAIEKSAPASVGYGDTITYSVDVKNVGHPLAIVRTNLVVTDEKAAPGTPLDFATVISGDTDTLLEKDEVWRYTLEGGGAVTLPANTCAPIDNTAVVAKLTGETNAANNTNTATTTVTCVPDVAITKSGPAHVEKDGTITYTVRVASIGHPLPIARADLHVTDPKVAEDAELLFSSEVSGNTDMYLDTDEVWEYALSGGAPVTLPATTCGTITNTALVAALTGETALANNTASATTFVRCPDYTVVKAADAATVSYSAGSVGWSVAATNTGNVDLALPALTDATVTLTGPASSLGEYDDPEVFQKDEVLTYTGTEQIAGRCGEIKNTVSAKVLYGEIQITRYDSATTTVVCTPDLAIVKVGPQSVNFGDTITYTVDVTSVGDPLPVARADVHVTDPAVAGAAELVFASVEYGNSDDMLEFGEVWRYRLAEDVAVNLPADRCAPIENTAIVALIGDGNAANDQSAVTTNVICTLNLTIAKASDKATYAAGETITYTVTVTNTGQAAVPFADIQVSDTSLPALTLVGEAPAELAPQGVLTYTGTRTTSIADCGTVPNTATVALAGEAQETTTADNTATRNVTVACMLNLAIAKAADKASYLPGELITYTVTVHNNGQMPVPFGQISVSDPTLPNLALVGAAPTALAVGASVSYTGTRQATAADCGNVVNRATVALTGAAQAESATADNIASVTVAVAGGACIPVVITGEPGTTLAIRKVGPRSSQVRRAVRYTLRVTNTGGAVARNVIVRDPVPAGMTVAKLTANATLSKRQVRWSIGDLQPGQSTTVSVLLRAEGNTTRRLCNTGFSSASNAPEASSRACTRFTRIAGVVRMPRVTG